VCFVDLFLKFPIPRHSTPTQVLFSVVSFHLVVPDLAGLARPPTSTDCHSLLCEHVRIWPAPIPSLLSVERAHQVGGSAVAFVSYAYTGASGPAQAEGLVDDIKGFFGLAIDSESADGKVRRTKQTSSLSHVSDRMRCLAITCDVWRARAVFGDRVGCWHSHGGVWRSHALFCECVI
jgi:hypothetical protein